MNRFNRHTEFGGDCGFVHLVEGGLCGDRVLLQGEVRRCRHAHARRFHRHAHLVLGDILLAGHPGGEGGNVKVEDVAGDGDGVVDREACGLAGLVWWRRRQG